MVVSRGELVEIGAGFRLPDLIASTGARLREVGTTNRTHLRDYADGHRPATPAACSRCIPATSGSSGFTSAASHRPSCAALADEHGVPLVADLGSGLLAPDPLLPDEPDVSTALAAGADVVTASGDKLLGGPQAGLVLGPAEVMARLARHPLARAVRADKLTLAALEATVIGGTTAGDGCAARRPRPAARARRTTWRPPPGAGWSRMTDGSAAAERPGFRCRAGRSNCPNRSPAALRTGDPAVLPRVHDGACLIDLRCVPEADDERLLPPFVLHLRTSMTGREPRAPEMFVVATAGHVDHGKSTLVRALTGMEPDRWAEERRRGLTIDLGFAWTTLPSGRDVSFVDVPGHERFLGNMLAGLGPAPVVCFVVAADEGWQAQSSDHRDAIAAFGISHGVVVLTRSDRAPERAAEVLARVRAELAGTGLHDAPAVTVSAVAGTGLDELRRVLDQMWSLCRVPTPRLGCAYGLTVRSASAVPGRWSPGPWRRAP